MRVYASGILTAAGLSLGANVVAQDDMPHDTRRPLSKTMTVTTSRLGTCRMWKVTTRALAIGTTVEGAALAS